MIVALAGLFSYLFFLEDLQWTEQIYIFYIFTTMEDESEGWDSLKLA